MFERVYKLGRCTILISGVVLTACAVNPATGARELSLIGEGREVEMGRQSDAQVVAAYGLVDDAELQAYVSDLGTRLAAVSERPDLPWEFKVVDDPIVNAFALPGGFIYVTRGILVQFDSEAELAGVLGHEIGHVTARHSVNQISRQQVQSIALGVGSVFSETVAQYGQIGAAALGVLNLRYSRGDESESDMLGLRYISRVGYDPDAMIGVFEMLATAGGSSDGARLPEWQLTHPYPENRAAEMRRLIAEQGLDGGTVGRNSYVDMLDGLVYGDDPRQGYFVGSRFYHPELRFQLAFPDGWRTLNQRSAVMGASTSQDAAITLTIAEGGATPVLELREFLRQEGITGGTVQESTAGGIERARATFRIDAEEGSFEGEAAFVRAGGVTYRLLGYAEAAAWPTYRRAVATTLGSFDNVSDPAVLGVEPLRVDIVTISEPMSVTRFHQRFGAAVDVEELATLNRTAPGAVMGAGTRVKTVVGDPVG